MTSANPWRGGNLNDLIVKFTDLGATHIVVLGKFYRDLLEGTEVVPVRAELKFYRTLDQGAKLVWHIERGQNLYIHPGLSIYELR